MTRVESARGRGRPMARQQLRQKSGRSSAGMQRLPLRVAAWAAAGFATATVVVGAVLLYTGRDGGATASLEEALGRPVTSSSLVQRPTRGVVVGVDPQNGYVVTRGKHRVSVTVRQGAVGRWKPYERGFSRMTAFGRETVTIEPGKTEQF